MTKSSIPVSGRDSAKVRRGYFSFLRLIQPKAWVLVFSSALLQIASFPVAGPLPYWRSTLAWIAVAPLVAAIFLPDKHGKDSGLPASFVLGYFCGLVWYAGNCYWIYQTMYLYGGLPKPVALFILLLFALYLGLYHALFAGVVARLRRLRWGPAGALYLAPFVWVAVELARARITGFPWDLLGNSQVDNRLVTWVAPLAGVMGISFLVAAVNACFAAPFVVSFVVRRVRGFVPAAGALLLAALLLCFGVPHASELSRQGSVSYAVLMQENLSVGATARGRQPVNAADELLTFSAMSLAPESASRLQLPPGAKPSLIVWPEAPSHFRSDDPGLQQKLGELARTANAAVIAGDIGVVFDGTAPKGYYEYDSASLFNREGQSTGRYDKIHLVPWGEYVPFKHVFAFAEKLTEGVGDMDPGHDRTVFQTDGHAYGVFICYESIFGDEIRQFVKNGADVLVNISDDGWYGDTGAPWQHLNMARMRAIENHRYLIRSTNTGITTVIDPLGRTSAEAPRHVRAAFVFPFAYQTGMTLYTAYGDWFAYLCALVTLAGVAFSFVRTQRLRG